MLSKSILDKFMRQIGAPLNWYLDHDDYEFNEEISEENNEKLKKEIYMTVCEYIYDGSKTKV
jgi:hypothetical protein